MVIKKGRRGGRKKKKIAPLSGRKKRAKGDREKGGKEPVFADLQKERGGLSQKKDGGIPEGENASLTKRTEFEQELSGERPKKDRRMVGGGARVKRSRREEPSFLQGTLKLNGENLRVQKHHCWACGKGGGDGPYRRSEGAAL